MSATKYRTTITPTAMTGGKMVLERFFMYLPPDGCSFLSRHCNKIGRNTRLLNILLDVNKLESSFPSTCDGHKYRFFCFLHTTEIFPFSFNNLSLFILQLPFYSTGYCGQILSPLKCFTKGLVENSHFFPKGLVKNSQL